MAVSFKSRMFEKFTHSFSSFSYRCSAACAKFAFSGVTLLRRKCQGFDHTGGGGEGVCDVLTMFYQHG